MKGELAVSCDPSDVSPRIKPSQNFKTRLHAIENHSAVTCLCFQPNACNKIRRPRHDSFVDIRRWLDVLCPTILGTFNHVCFARIRDSTFLDVLKDQRGPPFSEPLQIQMSASQNAGVLLVGIHGETQRKPVPC